MDLNLTALCTQKADTLTCWFACGILQCFIAIGYLFHPMQWFFLKLFRKWSKMKQKSIGGTYVKGQSNHNYCTLLWGISEYRERHVTSYCFKHNFDVACKIVINTKTQKVTCYELLPSKNGSKEDQISPATNKNTGFCWVIVFFLMYISKTNI